MIDPLKFAAHHWPDVKFYKEQAKIIYSVFENTETYVPAGNKLGKDFVAGFIVLAFFLTRWPCRIVTTSVKDDHLRVLWGEIGRFIQTAKYPLKRENGGPLIVNHRELRKVVKGEECKISYVKGMVSQKGEGLQGHHASRMGVDTDTTPLTLFVVDEASAADDEIYRMSRSWAHRTLAFGNCWPCENFFKRAVKGRAGTTDNGGDVPRLSGEGYYRKVIRIQATDSPNVKAKEQLIPGVKTYAEYVRDEQTLDDHEKSVILYADWYEGAEVKMFPEWWLTLSAQYANQLEITHPNRTAKSMGIDSAEGGDNTAKVPIDEMGVIDLETGKTPDTSRIPTEVILLGNKYHCPPENWLFDRGGGGKQHADAMRRMGYNVRTVGFGESVSMEKKSGIVTLKTRKLHDEDKYAYKNRRAQMYGELRNLLRPVTTGQKDKFGKDIYVSRFAIPERFHQFRQQLLPIPLEYDREGRLMLPPKNKQRRSDGGEDKTKTLIDLIGHSPDEADALVLAVFGMMYKPSKNVAGLVQ